MKALIDVANWFKRTEKNIRAFARVVIWIADCFKRFPDLEKDEETKPGGN